MPIRAENRDRYPADWKAIRAAILDRAGNRCEQCKAPNGEVITRGGGIHAGSYMLMRGEVFDDKTGDFLGVARGSEYSCARMVKVVLTIAHLDHTPENNDPANLRAWCQRCHNAYDAPMRRAGIRDRARAQRAARDLLDGEGVSHG